MTLGQKTKLEKILKMEQGYVLDFTDKTFLQFFEEHGINIDDDRYCINGNSKAKRIRVFFDISNDYEIVKILHSLVDDWIQNIEHKKDVQQIIDKLLQNTNVNHTTNNIADTTSANISSVQGNGNTVTQITYNYYSNSEDILFKRIEDIANSIQDNNEILYSIQEMKNSLQTDNFKDKYKNFISVIADHIGVFSPILIELSRYL